MAQNITIPIKKPDGTIVKVSMADFMAYKRTGVLPDDNSQISNTGETSTDAVQSPTPVAAPNDAVQNQVSNENMETALAVEQEMDIVPLSQETELAVSTPNTHIFEEMAAANAQEMATSLPSDQIATTVSEPETLETTAVPKSDDIVQPPAQEDMAKEVISNTEETYADSTSQISEELTQNPEEIVTEKKQLKPTDLSTPLAGDDSLHDEPLEHNDLLDPTTEATIPSTHDAHVDAIISRAGITMSDELQERLRMLVQSRVKEVRDDDAVMVQAIKSTESGGLGLDEKDAVSLLMAMRIEMNLKPLHFTDMVAPATAIQTKNEPEIEQKKRSYLPPATPLSTSEKPILQDVVQGTTMSVPLSSNASLMNTSLNQSSSGYAYQTMGPIDEIEHFSLEDLHRLGNDKERVVSIMKTKFTVLKDESYILFLDAVNAWKKSPLFMDYQKVVIFALNNRKTINQALQENNFSLQMQDFDIIIEINKIAN